MLLLGLDLGLRLGLGFVLGSVCFTNSARASGRASIMFAASFRFRNRAWVRVGLGLW